MATDFELLERLRDGTQMGTYVEDGLLRHPQGGIVAKVDGGHVIIFKPVKDEVIHAHHWTLALARTRWNVFQKLKQHNQEVSELVAIEKAAHYLYDLGFFSRREDRTGERWGVVFQVVLAGLDRIPRAAVKVTFLVSPENLPTLLGKIKGLALYGPNQKPSDNGPE